MGKKKESLPNTPTYQEDPVFREAFGNLATNSQNMATLNLADNPNLLETIQFHPEMLTQFMNTLEQQMMPAFDRGKQDLTNELANLGALESSTTSNKMGDMYDQFRNTLQVQSGQYGLATMEQAMQNRINIAGMGMQGLSHASTVGVQTEANRNNFNLANYENQVAKQLYDNQNSGGWLGALQGGIGGAMSGFAMGGGAGALAGGIGGGALGYFGNSSQGSGILNMGLGAQASRPSTGIKGISGSGAYNYAPVTAGRTAGNNLFRDFTEAWDARKR